MAINNFGLDILGFTHHFGMKIPREAELPSLSSTPAWFAALCPRAMRVPLALCLAVAPIS